MSGEVYWPEHVKRGDLIYWDGSATATLGGQAGYIPVWGSAGIPIWVPPASIAALLDHGLLLGLGDDDHLQYALLNGRPAGQTLIGGSTSGRTLQLIGSLPLGTGGVVVGVNAAGNDVVLVNETNNEVKARGWVRIGGTAAPTQALSVTGDIGGSNELQVPRGRFTDNNIVYNSMTVGANFLANLNALDVLGNGVVNANTGFRIGNAAPLNAIPRGDGTNFVAASAGIDHNSLTNRTRAVWIPVNAMLGRDGQFPAVGRSTIGTNDLTVAQPLSNTAVESMAGSLVVPEDYASGGTLKVYWTNLGAGAGNVAWYIAAIARAAGGDLNSTTGTLGGVQAAVAAPAQNILAIHTPAAVSGLVAGQHLSIICGRLPPVAGAFGDTLANAVGLIGVKFEYTADM